MVYVYRCERSKMVLILTHFWWKVIQTIGSDNFTADSSHIHLD